MIRKTIGLAGTTAVVLLASASAAMAEDGLTAQQEQQMREIVRTYLLEHPEIINEAIQAHQERLAAEAAAKSAQALKDHRDDLRSDPMSPVGGNPNGAVTVVEFFDYNCGYCRAAGPTVTELLKRNPQVRFVYKEFPTLAPTSRYAARAALAAHRQSLELYTQFHDTLMKSKGRLAEDAVVQIARASGIDVDRMRADMEDPAINASLDRNIALARAIGISGTPTFVIGEAMLVGVKPLQEMESAVAKARPAEPLPPGQSSPADHQVSDAP